MQRTMRRPGFRPTLTAIAALAVLACGPAASRDNRDDGPEPAAPPDARRWTTYVDRAHGFSLRYPDSVVILPESTPLPERRPPIVYRVRFMDKTVAASESAGLEVPDVTIEVFAPPTGPLRSWLSRYERLAPGREPETLAIAGAKEALRVRDPRQSAPNEFVYLATDKAVIAVIPLGADGETMAASFALAAEK